MKAKELMIGDWVSYCNEFFQVDYLHRITDTIGLKYNNKNPNFQDGAICAEDATPIPLTPEILEKNGFRFMESKRLVFIPDEGGSISYHTDTHYIDVSGDGCVKKNIGYIHELQHALRLCGLNDLADNFKVV